MHSRKNGAAPLPRDRICAALLEVLRFDLFQLPQNFSSETDWEAVYHELGAQGVRGLSEQTLKYITENGIVPQNGQAAALNLALRNFSGELLMWIDSDDMLEPTAVSEMAQWLSENPDKDFVVCDERHVRFPDFKTEFVFSRKKFPSRIRIFMIY